MVELLKYSEGLPATAYPLPPGLSPEAQALDPAALWSRIEFWTSYRWAERSFEAIVEGPGEWIPPVEPVTFTDAEIWVSDHWEASELRLSALGLEFGCGRYRVIGACGVSVLPAEPVLEAYRRLAEYLAESQNASPFLRSIKSGELTMSFRTEARAIAQALQLSGAADLLRPFRRLK